MRKAVSGASRRKDRRKDDDIKERQEPEEQQQQQQPLLPSQPPPKRERVDVQQQPERRRVTPDEAALQQKNYRLAKELSEIRVRHREECKHVSRLTMENMDLASRCREAVGHSAMFKKELLLQKKKANEAIAMVKKLEEQLAALQQKDNTSSTCSESGSSVSQNLKISNSIKSKESNTSSRRRIVSEDNSTEETSIKSKTSLPKSRSSSASPTPPIDVDAEMERVDQMMAQQKEKELERVDQILAEHQEKELERVDQIVALHKEKQLEEVDHFVAKHKEKVLLRANERDSKKSKDLKKQRPQKVVEAVINHQQPSEEEQLERIISIAVYDNDDSEHKSSDDEYTNHRKPQKDETKNIEAEETTSSKQVEIDPSSFPERLVSSDDYEGDDDDIVEVTAGDALDHQFTTIEYTTREKAGKESWLEDVVGKSIKADSPAKRNFFPHTASPKIDLSGNGSKYNEDFPEDIAPRRSLGSSRKNRLIPPGPVVIEDGESSTGVASTSSDKNASAKDLSSIDAFEASFQTSFPESFSPREEAICEEDEEDRNVDKSKKDLDEDVYDPFSHSPRSSSQDALMDAEVLGSPIFQAQIDLSDKPEIPDILERQPLLISNDRKGISGSKSTLDSKKEQVRNISPRGSGIRDRAAAAYHRTKKLFDPPGRDKTSPRPKSETFRKVKYDANMLLNGAASTSKPNGRLFSADGLRLSQNDDYNPPFSHNENEVKNLSTISANAINGKVRQGSVGVQDKQKIGPLTPHDFVGKKKEFSELQDPSAPKSAPVFLPESSPIAEPANINFYTPVSAFPLGVESPQAPQKEEVIENIERIPVLPARPEKKGFDAARAKYEKALGVKAEKNSTDRFSENSPHGTPIQTPSPQLIRDRVAKYIENASTSNLSNGKDKRPSMECPSPHSSLFRNVAPFSEESSSVNRTQSLLRPAEDEGDIPMVSKLSPKKLASYENPVPNKIYRRTDSWGSTQSSNSNSNESEMLSNDYSAASRISYRGRNVNLSQATKSYRRHDSFERTQTTPPAFQERREIGT